MPKTVTLSDDELAALQAMRQVVADAQHPARPAAIAALDRIAATADGGPVVTRSGQQPLDLSFADGYRCSTLEWRSDRPLTDIAVPAGEDLHLALVRPDGSPVIRWGIDVGDPGCPRAVWRLALQAVTRPVANAQTAATDETDDHGEDADDPDCWCAFADRARAESGADDEE